MSLTISIIGTAGRDKENPLNIDHVFFMENKCLEILEKLPDKGFKKEDIVLVSGAAAGADHTAVRLNLFHGYKIKLYLPAAWDHECFVDTKEVNWRTNPGGTCNFYHRKYSRSIWGNSEISLCELHFAIRDNRNSIEVHPGFHNRNSLVANSDGVIAFTFGEGDIPIDGGTKDTWDKAVNAERKHFSLKGV